MLALFILLLISSACFLFGLFLLLYPRSAIEMQEKFYKKINWKIEPVSMEKEIRSTKFMGMFLVLATFLAVIFGLWR
jgi:hypothetical protein